MDEHLEHEPKHKGIDREVDMHENESFNKVGYAETTHRTVRRMIC